MTYNLSYNICGIALILIILIFNFITNRLPSRINFMFRVFSLTILGSVIINTIAAAATPYVNSISGKYALSIAHLLLVNSVSAVYFLFTLSVAHDKLHFKRKHILLFAIPYAYMISIILTSPFSHFVFYFDAIDGSYHQNIGMHTLYAVNIFFIASCVAEITAHGKRCSKMQITSMVILTIGITAVMIFQACNPNYLLLGFVSSIGLYIINISLRNPKDFIENNTGVYNRSAFREYYFYKSGKLKNDYFALVHLKNFDTIQKTYGTASSYYIIKQLIQDLKKKANVKFVFYLFHNGYIFSTKTKEEAENIINLIHKYVEIPVKINPDSDNSNFAHVTFITDFYLVSDPQFVYEKYSNQKDLNPCEVITEIFKYAIQVKTGKEVINYIENNNIIDYELAKKRQIAMHQAIEAENFEVFLQPIWNLETKSFTGAESLLRLKDNEGKYIPPSYFIPDAERDGSILKLGEISLRKTCEFIIEGQVRERGISKVNINLSMVQCMQDNIVQKLISIIEEYNIPKTMIRFEITETMMASDPERLLSVMEDLQGYGIEFALDDYGTGFSNTSRLLKFPFTEIKFDKSFINAVLLDKKNEIPLRHLMEMVKEGNMIALVEGVEEKEISDLVESFGADLIQGYYYSEPLPLAEFCLKLNHLAIK